jgi:hypothetical protein
MVDNFLRRHLGSGLINRVKEDERAANSMDFKLRRSIGAASWALP